MEGACKRCRLAHLDGDRVEGALRDVLDGRARLRAALVIVQVEVVEDDVGALGEQTDRRDVARDLHVGAHVEEGRRVRGASRAEL